MIWITKIYDSWFESQEFWIPGFNHQIWGFMIWFGIIDCFLRHLGFMIWITKILVSLFQITIMGIHELNHQHLEFVIQITKIDDSWSESQKFMNHDLNHKNWWFLIWITKILDSLFKSITMAIHDLNHQKLESLLKLSKFGIWITILVNTIMHLWNFWLMQGVDC